MSIQILLRSLKSTQRVWDGVAETRKELKDSLIKKEPGHSFIEVQGVVEKFTVGRILHSRIQEIVGVLKVLSFIEDDRGGKAFIDDLLPRLNPKSVIGGGVVMPFALEILNLGLMMLEFALATATPTTDRARFVIVEWVEDVDTSGNAPQKAWQKAGSRDET
ncbi:hypothetical protein Tco_0934999 [Tanacetum coccineum]